MSKNLTRKGLALGAVVALSSTLIAGSPAFAASVLFAPTTGTGNTLVAGETFSLTASLSSDLPASNATQLKFKVANTTGVAATVTLNSKTIIAASTTPIAHGAGYAPVALDASVGGTTAGSALAAGTTSAVFGVTDTAIALADGTTTTPTTSVVAGAASTATNPTTIKIASTAATTASYTVTAFLDANNNGAVDTGELSTAQTINFVKVADSGLTTTFTKPTIASTALKAVLTFGADVNVAQLTPGNYSVAFGRYGTTGKVLAAAGTVFTTGSIAGNAVAAYDAVNNVGKLISSVAANATPLSGATFSAQPVFGGALVASEVFQVVAASADADATALTVAPTVSNDVVQVGTSTVYNVRTGVAASAVKATIKKTPTDGVATAVGAGVVVNVTITAAPVFGTASGATTADTITVNGAAVTTANYATYATTAVTDATGVVTVPVVTSSGAATNSVTVTLAVANAASTATGVATLTWLNASLVAPVDLIVGSNTPVHVVTKGAAYTASYALRDNYNALYTGSAYRLVYTSPGVEGATAPTSQTVYVPFVNGVAVVSITDNSTGAGVNAATFIVQKNTDGLWAQAASPLNTTVAAPYTVKAIAQVASAVTATETTTQVAREVASTFATVDQRVNFNGVAAPSGFTASSNNVIAGQVTDASGVGVAGASVTVAAAGIQFISGSVFAVGSITVTADATGNYTVTAYSHTAGKVTYTVTSGAATKTVSVTYAAVSGRAGTALTLTAPATVLPGRTLTVTGLLVDKFGNPVNTATATSSAFSVVYDGPGLVVGNAITATDAAGSFTLRVLLGAADSGTATVTATYGGANGVISSSDVVADADIIKVATVTIGAAAVSTKAGAVVASKNGRVYVTVNNAAGFVSSVKVGFSTKPSFRAKSASQLVSYFVGAGKRVAVVVSVRGGIVASQAITIK